MTITSYSRLGTASIYDSALRNINNRQAELAALQDNVTSGKRVVRASDDPTSAGIAERSLTRLSRIATDQRALASQTNAIKQAESTLGEVTDALKRFRELTVSAGNGSYSSTERKTIALEMQGLRDHMFALANSKDSNGLPLFSALGSALQPFVGPEATSPDYQFNGLPGTSASSTTTIPFALDGDSAFMLAPTQDASYNVSLGSGSTNTNLKTSAVSITDATLLTGSSYSISNITTAAVVPATVPATNQATYNLIETLAGTSTPLPAVATIGPVFPGTSTDIALSVPGMTLTLTGALKAGDTVNIEPNVSLFSVLDNAIKDIGQASSNNTASQAISQALHNIDISAQRVSAVRSQAGELLNRADRITGNQEKRGNQMEADRSRAEDLDMIKGLSDVQNKESGLQVALQTYAKVQKISLFDYIG